MVVYIDDDNMCHVSNDGTMRAFEILDLDGKCKSYIEGCRYVPKNEYWTRSDGEVFEGEMLCHAKDSRILEAYQEQYEAMFAEMEDMKTALETLEVRADG